jgi:hypothetical protein
MYWIFVQDFDRWTKETFKQVGKSTRDLCDLLWTKGIYFLKQTRLIARDLFAVLN